MFQAVVCVLSTMEGGGIYVQAPSLKLILSRVIYHTYGNMPWPYDHMTICHMPYAHTIPQHTYHMGHMRSAHMTIWSGLYDYMIEKGHWSLPNWWLLMTLAVWNYTYRLWPYAHYAIPYHTKPYTPYGTHAVLEYSSVCSYAHKPYAICPYDHMPINP